LNVIKRKIFDLIQLANDEAVPAELIEGGRAAVVQQGTGFFYLKSNPLFTNLTPIEATQLDDIKKKYFDECVYPNDKLTLLQCKYKDFTFPVEEFKYIMAYFREIYKVHKTEAGVLLLLHPEKKLWKVFIPIQVDCSGASVNYLIPLDNLNGLKDSVKKLYEAVAEDKQLNVLMQERIEAYNQLLDEGWCLYGTIHSHCDFSAFHSGVDDNDETHFEGLHITIGDVMSGWSFSSRFMLDGYEIKLELNNIFGITDEEMKAGIDDIEVLDTDMAYIAPEVGRSSYTYTGKSFHQPYRNSSDEWDSENIGNSWSQLWPDGDNSRWFSQKNDDEDDDDFEENVFEEDNIVRLMRKSDRKIVYVLWEYYITNRDKFSSNNYLELKEEETGSDFRTAKPKKDLTHQEDSLYIFDSKIINPLFPVKDNRRLRCAEYISDIRSYTRDNKKRVLAKKKDRHASK
jgi:hypothetical protein